MSPVPDLSGPSLVQTRLYLPFTQAIAMAMVFAPGRRPSAPGRRDHPGYWCNMQAEPHDTVDAPRRRWLRWLRDIVLLLLVFAGVQWWQARDLAQGAAPPLPAGPRRPSPAEPRTGSGRDGPTRVHLRHIPYPFNRPGYPPRISVSLCKSLIYVRFRRRSRAGFASVAAARRKPFGGLRIHNFLAKKGWHERADPC